ncbi:MAG: hypothetical protein ACTHW4_10990 [Actinomycetales bacterium]
MTTQSTRSRAASLAAVLIGSLALAACGDGDDDSGSGGADEGTEPGSESSSESGSAAGPGGSASESASEVTFDGPSVEVDWPSGWEDMSSYITATPEGAEVQAYGDPASNFAASAVVMSFGEEFVQGRSYDELLEAQGTDTSTFAPLAEREIDGTVVAPFERLSESATGPVTQRLYPVELEDGGIVEITVMGPQETFYELEPTFEELLDSVAID